MSSTKGNILCGSCKCAVKAVPNPKPHDQVTCPRCNRSDRFDKVMNSVGDHVAYLTHKSMAESLSRSTRSNSFIKFSANKPANRSFRWISDIRI